MNNSDAIEMALMTLESRAKADEPFSSIFKEDLKGNCDFTSLKNHKSDGAINRSNYIRTFIKNELYKKPCSKIATFGCGFSSYYFETGAFFSKWCNTDIKEVIDLRNKTSLVTRGGHRYYNIPFDLNIDNPETLVVNNEYGNLLDADIALFEGVLMYIDKDRAKYFVSLPWKCLIFDVLGNKRQKPLGPFHKWQHEFNEWGLNIEQKYNFDGPEIDSWLYVVRNDK
jgi:hypothetical protein